MSPWVALGVSGVSDNRFLLRQRQGWWAVVEVPPSLRQTLGRRLKRTLKTRDVAVARARRWAVVASLKGQIERARKAQQGDPLVTEALAWRGYLEAADDSADGGYSTADATRDAIATRVEELYHQGNPRWQELRDIAAGAATPVSLHGDEWRAAGLNGKPIALRTVEFRGVVLKDFVAWLVEHGEPEIIGGVTGKMASRYAEHLAQRSASVAIARVAALALTLDMARGARAPA